ncbi:subunit A of calcineurin [Hamiltosporidium magnivora]|uniref:Serine/threonine-protein phosphatase n=1 Tax=Hamiltosporidium magnivora TaxID=148818 RepID=A0A4Q9LLP2_9MICR|nr:subunit A of calcineurin [Hamiltosporidium magnivora]
MIIRVKKNIKDNENKENKRKQEYNEEIEIKNEKEINLEGDLNMEMKIDLENKIFEEMDEYTLQEYLLSERRLSIDFISKVVKDAMNILQLEKNVLEINVPTVVLGDIHGQFYDLINILSKIEIGKETVLFLGDYVDRGYFSIETYIYLLFLKIKFPKNIFLLRGNHECERLTKYFTFKTECSYKYCDLIYYLFIESFKYLPLAAIVLKKMFCVHGGLSPGVRSVDSINSVNRFCEIPLSGIICDLLWSDPSPKYDKTPKSFFFNENRRCSYFYSYEGVCNFLNKNNLLMVVRGHEVQLEGYKLYKKHNGVPSVITLFSAPNYCDAYKNLGSILKFDGKECEILQFECVEHPYWLPNFLDGLNWSFPFVAEKIAEFFLDLLKSAYSDESSSSTIRDDIISEEMKKAVNFSGCMGIMREERECLNEMEDEESDVVFSTVLKYPSTENLNYVDAKDKDTENETLVDPEIVEGTTLEVNPSCSAPISKKLKDAGLEVLEETKVIPKGDLQGVEIKKNRSPWCFFSCLGWEK